ncbi:MAG: hypothetical protein ACI9MR_001831 [Myxococcota bacterium]
MVGLTTLSGGSSDRLHRAPATTVAIHGVAEMEPDAALGVHAVPDVSDEVPPQRQDTAAATRQAEADPVTREVADVKAGIAETAAVTFISRPAGVTVVVDGKFTGQTPLTALTLRPAVHAELAAGETIQMVSRRQGYRRRVLSLSRAALTDGDFTVSTALRALPTTSLPPARFD